MSIDSQRISVTGRAIPVRGNDIDTDRIIPARYLKCVVFDGLGEHAFEDDRAQLRAQGKVHSFDRPEFQGATILFVNKNFGCGSSREHAPQAIMRWGKGIKGIVGESFAEIFAGNCVALGVPYVTADEPTMQSLLELAETKPETEFVLDLEARQVRGGGHAFAIQINDDLRRTFIEGRWDSTGELLAGKAAIAETATKLPYFNHWR